MKDYELHLWDEFRSGRLNRRELLRLASVAGVSLAAFGVAGTRSAMAQTEPKRGGTLRLAAQYPGQGSGVRHRVERRRGVHLSALPRISLLSAGGLDARSAPCHLLEGRARSEDLGRSPFARASNGTTAPTLTTDDVVATFERLLDPKVGSSAGSVYKGVLSFGNVEKVSDTDVRFHLDKPFVDFPYLVSGFAYQSAILPKNYEMGSFTKGGIGTGPFVLKEYVPHQHCRLRRQQGLLGKGHALSRRAEGRSTSPRNRRPCSPCRRATSTSIRSFRSRAASRS